MDILCTLIRYAQVLQEISNFKFGLSVGDESRRDGGLSGSFKLIKVDTPAAYFKNLKVVVWCYVYFMCELCSQFVVHHFIVALYLS